MEYIVSARKYRPLTFDTVVGQTTLTTTLKNAVKSGKLAHAYLFCGPRGVGKTTCARIFARAINCMNPRPDGEACGECESCRSFGEQRSFNIFELDAASNNSVEDIRQLMEQTRIPPQMGRYKVFIIDEVHMLSAAAFNAFLKTLEEPPAHVIFILATTEKHKLLPTIISRCQIYDFERITVRNIIGHLRMVAGKEGYSCEEEALQVIAEKADGAMRDALSVFDQVASYCQGDITYEKTIEDLNVLDIENYFRIVDFALSGKVTDIMLLLDGIIARGFDAGNLCRGLAGHIRNVMMAKDPMTTKIIEVSDRQRERYAAQAKDCPLPFLYGSLKLLNACELNYRQSLSKRLLVELTLIQMAQLVSSETAPGQTVPPEAKPQPQSRPQAQPAASAPERTSPAQAPAQAPAESGPAAEKPSGEAANRTSETAPAERPAPAKPAPAAPAPGAAKVRISGLGFTFAAEKEKEGGKEAAAGETLPESRNETPFNQEFLEMAWLGMCQRWMENPRDRAAAARLMNVVPKIKEYPEVELLADNSMILGDMRNLRERIRQELSRQLDNSKLAVSVRLAEAGEIKPVLSKAEMVEEMKKNNPAVELLFDTFDLEIS